MSEVKRLVYRKTLKGIGGEFTPYCFLSNFEDEVKKVLDEKIFNGAGEVFRSEDGENSWFSKRTYDISDTEFMYKALKGLKEEGFEFSKSVESSFNWYKEKFEREQAKKEEESLKETARKEESERKIKEELEKYITYYSCDKYGQTRLNPFNCQNCWYRLNHLSSCRQSQHTVLKEQVVII